MTSRADSLTHEDLQKAKESGMADIVEKLRNIDNISGDIEESEIERISIIGDEAAAEIERLRAALAEAREVIGELKSTIRINAMRNSQDITHAVFDEWWATTSAARWLERNP